MFIIKHKEDMARYNFMKYKILLLCSFINLLANDKKIGKKIEIIQTSSIIPIETKIKKANSDYIVIVEITNVLLVPSEQLFQDKRLFKKFFLQLAEEQKIKKEEYEKLLQKSKFRLSEGKWQKLIAFLMNNEIKVFGLELGKNDNANQLAAHEIKFSEKMISERVIYIKNFKKNIDMLNNMFNHKNLIVISCNRKFLEKIREYAQTKNTNCFLFEYTYLNNLPKISQILAKKEIIRLFCIK